MLIATNPKSFFPHISLGTLNVLYNIYLNELSVYGLVFKESGDFDFLLVFAAFMARIKAGNRSFQVESLCNFSEEDKIQKVQIVFCIPLLNFIILQNQLLSLQCDHD